MLLSRNRRIAILVVLMSLVAAAFPQNSEQVQVGPPPMRRAAPPSPGASAEELEHGGDGLRAEKNYLDAIDYYEAALKKTPDSAAVLNKMGICYLQLQRYKEARKYFDRSIKKDRTLADAYNNLGVVYYLTRDYGRAIRRYEKAITLDPDAASYYSNLAAAYFSKRKFAEAAVNYGKALQLDPDIFDRISRAGVQAQISKPEDQARFDYVLAKIYAKMGIPDRSLRYLRKAMEEGYKDIGDVYKDSEFAQLRKDPRFTELMAAKPPAVTE
jgi:tetratricopeptide (TPR) repeat protein